MNGWPLLERDEPGCREFDAADGEEEFRDMGKEQPLSFRNL